LPPPLPPRWALSVVTCLDRARGTLESADKRAFEQAQKEEFKELKAKVGAFLDGRADVTRWVDQNLNQILSEITKAMFVIDPDEAGNDSLGACVDVAENCLDLGARVQFLAHVSYCVPPQYLPKCDRLLIAIDTNSMAMRPPQYSDEMMGSVPVETGFLALKGLACRLSADAPDKATYFFNRAADFAESYNEKLMRTWMQSKAVDPYIELAQAAARISQALALTFLRRAEEKIAQVTYSDAPGPDGFDISKAKGGDITLGISMMMKVASSLADTDPTRAASIFRECALAASQRPPLIWRVNLTVEALSGLAQFDKPLATKMIRQVVSKEHQPFGHYDQILARAQIAAGCAGWVDLETARSLINESAVLARAETNAKKRVELFRELVVQAGKIDGELAGALREEQLIS